MKLSVIVALVAFGSSALAQSHLACKSSYQDGALQKEITEWIAYGYNNLSTPFLKVDYNDAVARGTSRHEYCLVLSKGFQEPVSGAKLACAPDVDSSPINAAIKKSIKEQSGNVQISAPFGFNNGTCVLISDLTRAGARVSEAEINCGTFGQGFVDEVELRQIHGAFDEILYGSNGGDRVTSWSCAALVRFAH
jgi:hypothetical protein